MRRECKLWISLPMAIAFGTTEPLDSATVFPAKDPVELCKALQTQVDAASEGDPSAMVFLRSYAPAPTENALPPPLANAAFSYDNALAIIALVACHDNPRAQQIGQAFLHAIVSDRTFHDGRVRNAYRAGRVDAGQVALPGWWDDAQKLWAEDVYQVGSQSGNVAWVAFALLTLDEVTHDETYRRASFRLANWLQDRTAGDQTTGGFSGGVSGFDPVQNDLLWRSTEHNVDIYALGAWLQRLGPDPIGHALTTSARTFLDRMFDRTNGMFRLGTLPDGQPQSADKFALDALIWPLVGVTDALPEWQESLAFAKLHLSVPGGFNFNGEGDGLWTEGTAQAALVERALGDKPGAEALLATAIRQSSPLGLLFATDGKRISTGLKVSDSSKENDFFYFHRPHVGATAWAILAAIGFNPFTGRRID